MEELITCALDEFVDKIEKMPIRGLQELLWKLEDICDNMQKEKETTQNFQSAITKRLMMAQKRQTCLEKLQSAKYQAVSQIAASITTEQTKEFSWGIKETEPTVILDSKTSRTYWVKVGGNAPLQENETIKVVDCGEFRWCDQSALSIEQMPEQSKGIPFIVSSSVNSDGTNTIERDDLVREMAKAEAKSGSLRLFKVDIKGEQELEYFMLGDLKELQTMDQEKLKTFLITTYLTKAHEKVVKSSLEDERCLYGGTIIENEDGRFEVRFYEKAFKAVEKANNSRGTCMTTSNRIIGGNIQDVLDGVSGRMQRRNVIRGMENRLKLGIER